jgi:hypothetical protein
MVEVASIITEDLPIVEEREIGSLMNVEIGSCSMEETRDLTTVEKRETGSLIKVERGTSAMVEVGSNMPEENSPTTEESRERASLMKLDTGSSTIKVELGSTVFVFATVETSTPLKTV